VPNPVTITIDPNGEPGCETRNVTISRQNLGQTIEIKLGNRIDACECEPLPDCNAPPECFCDDLPAALFVKGISLHTPDFIIPDTHPSNPSSIGVYTQIGSEIFPGQHEFCGFLSRQPAGNWLSDIGNDFSGEPVPLDNRLFTCSESGTQVSFLDGLYFITPDPACPCRPFVGMWRARSGSATVNAIVSEDGDPQILLPPGFGCSPCHNISPFKRLQLEIEGIVSDNYSLLTETGGSTFWINNYRSAAGAAPFPSIQALDGGNYLYPASWSCSIRDDNRVQASLTLYQVWNGNPNTRTPGAILAIWGYDILAPTGAQYGDICSGATQQFTITKTGRTIVWLGTNAPPPPIAEFTFNLTITPEAPACP